MGTAQNYLTQSGYKKLKDELAHLRDVVRIEIATKIKEAREMGNIEENLVYDAVLEQQGFIEGRIAEIEDILSSSVVVEAAKTHTIVELGSLVVLEVNGQEQTFRIVGSAEANPSERLISNESPVGQALIGAKKGDIVIVKTPIIVSEYKILEIR